MLLAKEKVSVDVIIGMLVIVPMEKDANSNTICPYHKPVNLVAEKGNPGDHRASPRVGAVLLWGSGPRGSCSSSRSKQNSKRFGRT